MTSRILSWPAPGVAVASLDGPGALALAEMLAPVLRQRVQRGESLSPVEAAAVRSVLTGAQDWAAGAAIALATDLATDPGSEIDSAATSGGNWGCTTAEAGQRLRISQRAVRLAIARGDLESRQATAGGPHVITEQSIAAFEQKRIARRT